MATSADFFCCFSFLQLRQHQAGWTFVQCQTWRWGSSKSSALPPLLTNTKESNRGKFAVGADMLAGCSKHRNACRSQSLLSQCSHKAASRIHIQCMVSHGVCEDRCMVSKCGFAIHAECCLSTAKPPIQGQWKEVSAGMLDGHFPLLDGRSIDDGVSDVGAVAAHTAGK